MVEPGPKYCHFPRRDDAGYDYTYFAGLLSERQELKTTNGRTKYQWVKLPGHERNEALDCRNYATAALYILDPDMDAIERKIKTQCGEWQAEKKPVKKKSRVKRRETYGDAW